MGRFQKNKHGRLFSFASSRLCVRYLLCFCSCILACLSSYAQRKDILLNDGWSTSLNNTNDWKKVNVPHNWDDYYGYRRLLHGNLHGDAVYKRVFNITQSKKGKRFFLFFEGVGSYAAVFVNSKHVGNHAGGRTTFTLDITDAIKRDGTKNELEVRVSHPANINNLPWVCGGCSEERGFSEGSQPLGIFRPVHLIVTNDVRIEPFGVHAWADVKSGTADLFINSTIKNYSQQKKIITLVQQLVDHSGKLVASASMSKILNKGDSANIPISNISISNPSLWSTQNPYLYKIVTLIKEGNVILDKLVTDFGFRTITWKTPSHQFLLNGQPVFLNGIAEYEHLLGGSHAFSNEQISARMKWIQAAGFNAFRDGHQPHNLLYGKLCNEKGILWWTQLSAHVWYDTKEFKDNFKTLLKEWVIERRNDPSVILWGLQNESKLPKDFAEECTQLIRSLDPTASTQRLVTTCNGGEGTDWDVPQNWTGTYGGNPATYDSDLKKQVLVGEYGAWRTLDLHSEGDFQQNGPLSEDRMTLLMEQKVRLAEKAKDSVAGHFFWLLTSHDNPGRVQGGEGLRELDRVGPVNYKGILTPWEEPTDAYYMFRSNYADKQQEPMVYIVSHTWPNRWMTAGEKDGIIVYSNCDEVELFNDIDNASLGKQKRNGIGTHFQWDKVNIRYNVLYAVGYVNGKAVARDTVTLFHLPQSPAYNKLYAKAVNITKPLPGYQYEYRINCGGPDYEDINGNTWLADREFHPEISGHGSVSWSSGFPDMPSFFASQRRTFSPLKNTKDWSLFQSFRYGKDKLQFTFDIEAGEYLVELYFIEPWLGICGGGNSGAMRLFDVAINGKVIINDLDVWKEAGSNNVLKKIVKAKVTGGKMVISFPETNSGQALISAIAICRKEELDGRTTRRRGTSNKLNEWLDIGDKVFANGTARFNSLPSNLFGASWVQLNSKNEARLFNYRAYDSSELYVCVSDAIQNNISLAGFENTHTQIVTDEMGTTAYQVYRKLLLKGDTIRMNLNAGVILCLKPVSNMQPAYDLKPITQYRANVVKLGEGASKDSVNGRYCAVLKTKGKVTIGYPVQTGVADRYSLTVKYFYGKEQTVTGKLQLLDAGGSMMQEEAVAFTFTRPGKWNQFTVNTISQINAGNYTVRLILENAEGLALSSVDLQ